MSRESELRWFTGCIGVLGEADPKAVARAANLHGATKPVHWNEEKPERVCDAYKRLFGQPLTEAA